MKRVLSLFGILILAFSVRFYSLTSLPNGLHWDEMDTGYQAWSLLTTGRDYFGNRLPLLLHSLADFRTPVFIYADVPFVALFGLNAFSVRLISVIFGLLSVLLMYYLARQFFVNRGLAWFASLALALSPWQIQYSRQSVECNAMLTFLLLGLVAFYKSFRSSSWLWVSFLSFALSVASYSPAKFFVPLLLLLLVVQNFSELIRFPRRILAVSLVLFSLVALPIVYDGAFGESALRFKDVSIFTDPQVASKVDRERQYSQLGSLTVAQTGLTPRLMDKFLSNKPEIHFQDFIANYLGIFSPEYLFVKGDSELRHSPSVDLIGQFHLVEIILFLLGIAALVKGSHISRKNSWVLIFWFVVGAIPSSLTRGGGPHAARTFLMLPAFILLFTLGAKYLFSKNRWLFTGYLFLFSFSAIWYLGYFFNNYRLESAAPFQWGFDQVVNTALANSPHYDHVIVDLESDTGLMAYLFYHQVPPRDFQAMEPLPTVSFVPEVTGNQFGNILFLFPGVRNWTDIFHSGHYQGNNLIISSAKEPLLDTLPHISVINYPDGRPAFYSFTRP